MIGEDEKGKKASAFKLGVLVPKTAALDRFEAVFTW